jgi:hypothetical protein
MVKVFGCRPSPVARLGMGPAYENRPRRTRDAAAMVYGDLEFCLVVVTA